MDGNQYIDTSLAILVPVIYIIGIALKKSKVKNKYIPMILGITSISLCLVFFVSTNTCNSISDYSKIVFDAISQGVLIAGASVYANQLYIQSRKDE